MTEGESGSDGRDGSSSLPTLNHSPTLTTITRQMEPSLALAPSRAQEATAQTASIASTSSALGLHDAMRYGTRSLAADLAPKHPLQGRLDMWEETQDNLQLTMQRNMFGLHAPVRMLMERELVQKSNPVLSTSTFSRPSNVHLDVLLGKDETIEVADVLVDRVLTQEQGDFHTAMEKKFRSF